MVVMPAHIGLYYPFINFRSDAWLKTAALYWDKIARIVPTAYPTRDSDTVKALRQELAFIENVDPVDYKESTGRDFFRFVNRNQVELHKRYAVRQAKVELGYVFYGKMTRELVSTLIEAGLAIETKRPWPDWSGHWRYPHNLDDELRLDDELKYRWVGMHSELAQVYMTLLANRIAESKRLHPLAETVPAYMAIGAPPSTVGRALLESDDMNDSIVEAADRMQMAILSINTLAPADPDLPIGKIIKFVEKYGGEKARLQQHLEDLAGCPGLADIPNKRALRMHIDAILRKTILPELRDLKKRLRSARIDSILGLTSLKAVLPPLVPAIASMVGLTIDPVLGGLGALSFSIATVLRETEKATDAVYASSPASYLLRVQKLGKRPPILHIPARVKSAVFR